MVKNCKILIKQYRLFKKCTTGTGELIWWVKVIATKSDDLRFILEFPPVEGRCELSPWKLVSDLYTCAVDTDTQTHTK